MSRRDAEPGLEALVVLVLLPVLMVWWLLQGCWFLLKAITRWQAEPTPALQPVHPAEVRALWLRKTGSADPAAQAAAAAEWAAYEVLRQAGTVLDPAGRLYANGLFVWDAASEVPVSREVDLLAVTQRGIVVVEVKYKAGRIQVAPQAETWSVQGPRGADQVRNPLWQVQGACRMLADRLGLPRECFIPLVVFYAADSPPTLIGAPPNVVAIGPGQTDPLQGLLQQLAALRAEAPAVDVAEVVKRLNAVHVSGEAARAEHVERIRRTQLARSLKVPS